MSRRAQPSPSFSHPPRAARARPARRCAVEPGRLPPAYRTGGRGRRPWRWRAFRYRERRWSLLAHVIHDLLKLGELAHLGDLPSDLEVLFHRPGNIIGHDTRVARPNVADLFWKLG